MKEPDHFTEPKGAPDQRTRVLEWLREHPGKGITQLEALQHLAVMRLAAVIHRLREEGLTVTTELVELPTRYGPATVARYHLAPASGGPAPTHRTPRLPLVGEVGCTYYAPADRRAPAPVVVPMVEDAGAKRVDVDAMRRELFPD